MITLQQDADIRRVLGDNYEESDIPAYWRQGKLTDEEAKRLMEDAWAEEMRQEAIDRERRNEIEFNDEHENYGD